MARSNQSNDYERVITPINNATYYKVVFSAKKDKEGLNTSVYYTKPDASFFPNEKDYEVAAAIYEANEKAFDLAVEAGLETKVMDNGAKRYAVDLVKTLKNGNKVQSISGRLLNFYTVLDTFNDGKTKQKFVADIFDFDTNERYLLEVSIAVYGRKFIDKLCSLTADDLTRNIRISLTHYEYEGSLRVKPEVHVLDSTLEFGQREVSGTYELSTWNEKTGKYVAKPEGSKADNKEFEAALKSKIEDASDKPLIRFYQRIVATFQKDVLAPFVKEMFEAMGWVIEIKDEEKEKTVAGKTFTEKTREVIYLTRIEGTSSEVQEPVLAGDEKDGADDMPF